MAECFHQRALRVASQSSFLEHLTHKVLQLGRREITPPPYREPDAAMPRGKVDSEGPIFITARFRSGSTLLWQVFLRMKGFTAYYEPLNEQRWFSGKQRKDTDTTHRGVTDYSVNYEGLTHLDQYFTEDWTYKHLAMDEKSRDDALVSYVSELISTAADRPVLQFNRADFRLPFLKAKFPDVTIIHIERNCRNVWSSTLMGMQNNPNWTLETYAPYDRFYLLPYYRDLMLSFPWLRQPISSHPYLIHYLIWRLSQHFAAEHAVYSLTYKDLCCNFIEEAGNLMQAVGAEDTDLSVLDGLMVKRPDPYDHSKDALLYDTLEAEAEAILKRHLSVLKG